MAHVKVDGSSTFLKTRLKTASAFIFLGVAAVGLVGCGGDKDKGDKGGSQKSSSTVEMVSADFMGGKSPLDKPFTYKGGEELDVDGFFTAMADDGESKISYDSASFDKKSGATVITNLASPSDDNGGAMTIGRLELYGLNKENIEALKSDTPSEGMMEIFRKVRAYDISISDGGDGAENFTIGALEIDGLKIDGSKPENAEDMKDGQELAQALDSFSLGGIYMKDLSLQAKEGDQAGINVKLADLRLGGVEGGKFGGLYIAGMDYDMTQSPEMRNMIMSEMDPNMAAMLNGPLGNIILPGSQQASIGELRWGGADISGLMGYLRSGEKPPFSAKNLITIGGVETKDVVQKINGQTAMTSKKSVLDPITFEWLIPTHIASRDNTSVVNLAAYMPADNEGMMALVTDNGLDNIPSKSEFAWDYDTKGGKATLMSDTKMKGFANISFNFNVSEAKLDTIATALEAEDDSALQNIAIDGFSLRIEDENLLNLIFGIAGQQYNQSADEMRQTATGMMGLVQMQASQLGPDYSGFVTAVQGFMSEGGVLEIKMAPKEKLTLGSLEGLASQDPATIPETLGLTITHSK